MASLIRQLASMTYRGRAKELGYKAEFDLERGIADYLAMLRQMKARRLILASRNSDRQVTRRPSRYTTGVFMRSTLELPRLSLAERDRRYAAVRKQMAARGLDAIVLWGWPMMWDFYTANARYLSPIGGNAEFNVLIFPAVGEPTSIIQMPTFLEGWKRGAELGQRHPPTHQDLGRFRGQPHQGVEVRPKQDRDGRSRRSTGPGWLAAARRLQTTHHLVTGCKHRWSRRHAGENPRHQER